MIPIYDELSHMGIRPPPHFVAKFKARCPLCSSTRKKKRERCLTVRIEDERTAYCVCFHCAERGTITAQQGPSQ